MADKLFAVNVNPAPGRDGLTVLFAGRSSPEPGHHLGPQVLDYGLVHYVRSGRGFYVSRTQRYELSAGDCFFIFPGELVEYAADEAEPWSYRWVGYRGGEAVRLLATVGVTENQPVLRGCDLRTGALFGRVQQTLASGAAGADLEAGGWFRAALGRMTAAAPAEDGEHGQQPEDPASRQVELAIRWMNVQYPQPLSIENMAQSLGYHRTHLTKLFKQRTGMTPIEFLTNIRMERAKALLSKRWTIEQVASSVGYPDALYFSKLFKKRYGLSPTEYKQRSRPEDSFDCNR